MRQLLLELANDKSAHSLSSQFRNKRFVLFKELFDALPKPVKILDVGGRPDIWEREGFYKSELNCTITILNPEEIEINVPNICVSVGDARSMTQFSNEEFDIVFSNSVIEHVGGYDDQQKMANEIQRVGKQYFVQTPNKFFPVEPHFIFPLFQFFPSWLKILLIRNFSLGNRTKASSIAEARETVGSIDLLSKQKFSTLFPRSKIFEEKILGLTKSFVAYR